ncbi:MAG: hypothetical protein K5911_04920 [Eubacteriales bacterium]|nr:hypothetical protein [Eubacteriales bacterium]
MTKSSIKRILCIFAALLILISLYSCGKKEDPTPSGGNEPQQQEPTRPEYYWDINGSSEMPYKGSNRYLNYSSYASASSVAFTIASDEMGDSIAFMSKLFMDTSGEMMDVYNDSDYVTWYVQSSADFGYDPKGQKLTVRVSFYDYDKAPVELRLSRFLEDVAEDAAEDGIEGTLYTSALKSGGNSGYTAMYVRAQYEKETTLSDGTVLRQYCQCYKAYMPFEAPNGKTVYVEAEIKEVRNDPADLSDKSIVNFVFDRVHIGKQQQN